MKTKQSDYAKNYDTVRALFTLGAQPDTMFINELWTLPENWIDGLANFITTWKGLITDESIKTDVAHDINGFLNKSMGFVPRCFKGGKVWDIKSTIKKALTKKPIDPEMALEKALVDWNKHVKKL